MGMTNRVSPAQGEERGASFTLMSLDGDTLGKFQGLRPHFFKIRQFALRGLNPAETRKYGGQLCFPCHFLTVPYSSNVPRPSFGRFLHRP
jgi:hypothetical protein